MLLLGCDGAGCLGINQAAMNLVESFEGFVPSPRPDPIRLPTVGYGHQCKSRGCSEVPFRFPLTRDNAEALLRNDAQPFIICLGSSLNSNVKLNDNQWGALVSWTINVGCGNMKTSSLIRRLNTGQSPNTVATEELPQWSNAGGKVLPGLERRRKAEVDLFRTLSSREAYPSC
ncbi:hypothetical protein BGZ76_006113, partial [Entomortierella beljakovae]